MYLGDFITTHCLSYFFLRAVSTATKKECSPGPAYFIDPSITRSGRDGTPAYSLLARQTYLGMYNNNNNNNVDVGYKLIYIVLMAR